MGSRFLRRVACAAVLLTGTAAAADVTGGQQLFTLKCGPCHAAGGTGSLMLERRLGRERALLAERTDLPPVYVSVIVRSGLRSMPALTRVEVTDAQLDAITAYLVRPRLPAGATP